MMNVLSPTLVPSGQAESQDRHSSPSRIPTLDGWRGIAIGLVLIDHIQDAVLHDYARPWTQTGQHGVTIFFVLSGFLITSKLIEGPIDLKRFYVRRLFRLMPVAWTYLAALWFFGWAYHQHPLSIRETASCVLFYRNYFWPNSTQVAAHFWSLSVEEQFYLVWPCSLVILGTKSAKWFAALAALACAYYRMTHWTFYDRIWLSFHTEARADSLLVGCLLALVLNNKRIGSFAFQWSRVWTIPSIAVVFLCLYHFHWIMPLYESLAIAALIAASVLHPTSLLGRSLSFPPLAWLGTISYSTYVWQQFFFMQRPPAATVTMLCLLPFFVLTSYYCIERPGVRLGHRLTHGSGGILPDRVVRA